MKRYRLTRDASNDLGEIARYIAAENPAAAQELLDRIEDRCRSLAEMPEAGRLRGELAANLRSVAVGNYVIFYRPDEDGIQVIRVLHGSRDIANLFE
jgi:toxin ParE1/3/4